MHIFIGLQNAETIILRNWKSISYNSDTIEHNYYKL